MLLIGFFAGATTTEDIPNVFVIIFHLVPISGVRYTLLEDDHDIDLCKNCFRLGADFAESSTDMDGKVVINGKTIDNLTCGLIKIMQPVPIVKADVTEAEAMDVEPTHDDDAADEDGQDLQKALRLSVGAADDKSTISSKVDQSFEDFVDGIFSSVVGLLSDTLSGQRGGPRLGLMLGLLIDLVHHSSEEGGKFNRARKVATEISVVSSRLIHAAGKSSNDFQRSGRLALIMCLRALAYLLVEEHPKQEPTPSIKHDALDDVKSKAAADSKVIKCPAHGVPAVRRRCARGGKCIVRLCTLDSIVVF